MKIKSIKNQQSFTQFDFKKIKSFSNNLKVQLPESNIMFLNVIVLNKMSDSILGINICLFIIIPIQPAKWSTHPVKLSFVK